MEKGQPSRTAWSAARYRAAHQILDGGRILADPLAVPILGVGADELHADAARRGMRLFVAARSRFAEDALAAAVRCGVRRAIVLGAGLDTFAYRNPHPGLEVVEVDHHDTRAWKLHRLAEAGIAVPPSVTHLGVDLETEDPADRLPLDRPAFFLWLGVVPYLTASAFARTLRCVAARPGNHVVFDYAQSPDRMPPERRAALAARAGRVARLGEPWLTYFEPAEIAAVLAGHGFGAITDLGPAALAARFFDRPDVPPETPGGHVLHAVRRGP